MAEPPGRGRASGGNRGRAAASRGFSRRRHAGNGWHARNGRTATPDAGVDALPLLSAHGLSPSVRTGTGGGRRHERTLCRRTVEPRDIGPVGRGIADRRCRRRPANRAGRVQLDTESAERAPRCPLGRGPLGRRTLWPHALVRVLWGSQLWRVPAPFGFVYATFLPRLSIERPARVGDLADEWRKSEQRRGRPSGLEAPPRHPRVVP
jgi:hypothetical protein